MAKSAPAKRSASKHFQRNVFAGVITLIPLWFTWLVFGFVFEVLSSIGLPWVHALSRSIQPYSPAISEWLISSAAQYVIAALLTLLALYILGWSATQVIGRKLIGTFESIIERIPIAQTVYGGTKKLINVLSSDDEHKHDQVVLISFPSDSMKTVGFVTATFEDEASGQQLAAVYVPTTPNPTSGYLEIVPVEDLVPTNWRFDDAMTFIISGGAIAPETMRFSKNSRIE